ncbi:Acyl-CoA dehydrogenase [Amycolatopsis marina]|uniref:Acyl-CoA dehydrogenase n=1 Tax=Amycolatopsis marina TaxID=490629 RepID=A0A1I1BGY4_9PSEU|nr:acyl-CoA dehydrogenase family protein [Amycolatopsis marina]SFB48018.1 Acyl-CoA dehydrogenase [Amycolatopsis marina]
MTAVVDSQHQLSGHDDVVSAARAVADGIEDGAPVLPTLRSAGLLNLSCAALGDPATVLYACEAIGYANGSAGWLLASAQHARVLHWAEPPAQARVAAASFVTGSSSVCGSLEGDTSGFRVSGRWTAVPGATEANWFVLYVRSEDGPVAVLLPAEQVRIGATTEVIGLGAAACHEVLIDNALIDPAGVVDPFGPARSTRSATLPTALLHRHAAAGVAIGLARRALYEFTATARHRSRLGSVERMAEQPVLQRELNRTVSAFRAARALLLAETPQPNGLPSAHPALSRSRRVALAAAQLHAQDTALAAVRFAFAKAGGSALYSGHPLEIRWRDSETLAQQPVFGEAAEREVARAQFGSYVSPLVL